MKKYLEQRVEELELELQLIKAKIKIHENEDTTKYLNNYPKRDPLKGYKADGKDNVDPGCCNSSCGAQHNFSDYMHNSSINLMSEPDLETAFASHFDESEFKKNPLDTISINNIHKLDSDYPPYPEIDGSWDDDLPKNLNDDRPHTMWGFVSEFDRSDKEFLEWLSTDNAKLAYKRFRIETKTNSKSNSPTNPTAT